MMLACRCSTVSAFAPAARQQRRLHTLPGLSSARVVRCNAEEPSSSSQPAAAEQQPDVLKPPTPPASEANKFDYRDQPDALGPVGNFLMAGLLIFLCGASIFFTVGRQFQADLVPLEDEYAAMMAEAKQQAQ